MTSIFETTDTIQIAVLKCAHTKRKIATAYYSLIALFLKWSDITKERAMVVIANDIIWVKSTHMVDSVVLSAGCLTHRNVWSRNENMAIRKETRF